MSKAKAAAGMNQKIQEDKTFGAPLLGTPASLNPLPRCLPPHRAAARRTCAVRAARCPLPAPPCPWLFPPPAVRRLPLCLPLSLSRSLARTLTYVPTYPRPGMKNKNKSKKIQKFIQQQTGANGMSRNQEQEKMYREKKEKLKKEQEAREMALLFKQAPKSKAEIAREKAAKKMVKRQAKSAKIDLYADPRAEEKEARANETSADWDEAKLRQVIGTKAIGKDAKVNATDIVCKHFLNAVEKGLYGWFWKCPNGADKCMYKHNLPPGYVLKKKKGEEDEEEEDQGPSLEEIIEQQRAKLTAEGTPVTLESFTAWKAKKDKEKAEQKEEKKQEELKSRKLTKQERSLGIGMSGKDLFSFKPEAFVDDAHAADDVEQYLGKGLEEMGEDAALLKPAEKVESAFDDFDESAFDDVECEVAPSKERIQEMALEMIEAAKDMQEDGELETALAMFKQAWDDLDGSRPKLKIRIEALEKEIEEKAANAGEETYECMYKCGFEGSYEEVEAHEKACPKCTDEPGEAAETYECMHHCGFEGSYEQVEEHEAVCPKAASAPEPAPAAVDVDESLFDDSSDDSD